MSTNKVVHSPTKLSGTTSSSKQPKASAPPKGNHRGFLFWAAAVLLVAATWTKMRPTLPLEIHRWRYDRNVFTDMQLAELKNLVEGSKEYMTLIEDRTSNNAYIGEQTPVDKDGKCPHPLLVANNGICGLPSRADVAFHHIATGGRFGAKESAKSLSSRLISFHKYIFNTSEYEALDILFKSPRFVDLAKDICRGRGVFDPIQTGIIIMLPGQDLPMHYDNPWFWGADRFHLPAWLLTVMRGSGLFRDRLIHQIQGVTWLHQSTDPSDDGRFFVYAGGPGGKAEEVSTGYNEAIVVDGCDVIHGVNRYKPSAKVPELDKDVKHMLRFVGNEQWQVVTNGQVVAQYNTSDLRMSLVWRARCFESEEEKLKYQNQKEFLSLDEVLTTLKADLVKRGRLDDGEEIAPLDLALMMLREYVKYPVDNFHNAWFPYNYCVFPELFPSIKPYLTSLVKPFCE